MAKKKTSTNAVEILHRRYIGRNLRKHRALQKERDNLQIAQRLYEMRCEAGLTQAQVAKKVGTSTSVISRLESADYHGHTTKTLRDIAQALGRRLEINFVRDNNAQSM